MAAQEGGEPREAARPSSLSPPPPRAGDGPPVARAREEERPPTTCAKPSMPPAAPSSPTSPSVRATWLRRTSSSCCARRETCGWTWRPSRRLRRPPDAPVIRRPTGRPSTCTPGSSCPKTATRSGPRCPVEGCGSCSCRCWSSSRASTRSAGSIGPAIEALRRVVVEEPTREEAHVGLMRLYALVGKRGRSPRPVRAARGVPLEGAGHGARKPRAAP